MATKTDAPDLTRAQLIKVVRTSEEINGVGKMRALAALQRLQRKDVGDLLMEVVSDKQELPRFRHMALVGIYKLGGARANAALGVAAEHADELSAPTIATALGRVGTPDRLAVVERLASIAAPNARGRAQFAATLLAYRHSLDGHDVRPPTAKALQELGRRRSQPIAADKARADAAARALDALVDEPLEIDLTTESGLRIVCEPNAFVWLWTKGAAVKGFSAMAAQKGVAGALFRKRRFENAYSLSAIGLGTPAQAGVRLTVHRADSGQIIYAGTVAADGTLELRARNRPGLPAIDISARIDAGRVEVVKAKSATRVPEAKTPRRS